MIDAYGFLMRRNNNYDLNEEREWAEERAIDMVGEQPKPPSNKHIAMMEDIWEEIGARYY